MPIYVDDEVIRKIINSTPCPFLKNYYMNLFIKRTRFLCPFAQNNNCLAFRESKVFTMAELASFDGSHGKPAYAAVNGIVYDLSTEATWGGGSHFGLLAGKDLSSEFSSCHDNRLILNKLPVVGRLI